MARREHSAYELAKKLIDEAVKTGADCAKFQMRNMDTLYQNKGQANDPSADLGSQYTMDLLGKFQLKNDEPVSYTHLTLPTICSV